jgi:hypothetical protein
MKDGKASMYIMVRRKERDDDGAGDLSGGGEGTDVKRQMPTPMSEWKRRRKDCNFKSKGGVNTRKELLKRTERTIVRGTRQR